MKTEPDIVTKFKEFYDSLPEKMKEVRPISPIYFGMSGYRKWKQWVKEYYELLKKKQAK